MFTARSGILPLAAAAALLLAITMGSRAAFGLFVSPLNTATGLGLITISLAGAMSQLAWGAAQPLVGALAERAGPARVIACGGLLLALGTALVPFASSGPALVLVFTLIALAGAAAGSNGLLLGAVSRRVDESARGLVIGVVGAGGSAGQLVLGPGTQGLIDAAGWTTAMFALAALALLAVPLALAFREGGTRAAAASGGSAQRPPLRPALTSPAFRYIAAGFFVCGFHVAFLLAHMPGQIALCGLPASLAGEWLAVLGVCNIAGSLAAGAAIRRGSMRRALIVLYLLRALGVGLFLLLPASTATLLGFAAWMGLTYMATLPPTAGLIGSLFGTQRMATLLGVVMFVHQLGAFLGVWLGGIAMQLQGSYAWVWTADIVLAVLAAAIHLPLRERPNGAPQAMAVPPAPALRPQAA